MLTSGNWQVENIVCSIPAKMKKCTDRFELFYKNKHQNRNLGWIWNVGTVEMKPVFVTAKQHQLIMNVF